MNATTATTVKPLTVSAYAAQIQRMVKTVGPATVEGEVQNPRKTGGGALMFDFTDGESTLKAKVLPWTLRDGLTHEPADGELVRLSISHPDFWPKAGILSVVVDDVALAGDGELLRRRCELIERLSAEGLTNPGRFPPLPPFPSAIGLIAGAESAGLEDVIRALGDRYPVARVITACCQVQGAGAPQAVINSLARLDLHPQVEVIILSRGGGSPRDLMAFDDEALVRAISSLRTPVVAAIGHSENIPVCNHVTHSALTPSRVAELVVPDRAVLLAEIDDFAVTAARATRALRGRREAVETISAGLRASDRLQAGQRRILDARRVLAAAAAQFITDAMQMADAAREQLSLAPALWRTEAAERQLTLKQFADLSTHAVLRPAALLTEVTQLAQRLGGSARRIMRARETNWLRALDRQLESQGNATRRSLAGAVAGLEREGHAHSIAAGHQVQALVRETEGLVAVLRAGDFRRRGWLWATTPEGNTLTSIAQVRRHDRIRLHLQDGEVDAVAEQIHNEAKERL